MVLYMVTAARLYYMHKDGRIYKYPQCIVKMAECVEIAKLPCLLKKGPKTTL